MPVKEQKERVKLTAEVWKATMEMKSSEVFLENVRQADELRRPANSENPLPLLACKFSSQT